MAGNILAISSSPRKNGNSELLLQSFNRGIQKGGESVNIIRICNLGYGPCNACDRCAATGECILQDDMCNIYPLVASAKAMVIATPIYFGSLSAQLKMFIDRFQCWWYAKYRLGKPQVKPEEGRPGFFISVGALKNEEHAKNALSITKIYLRSINYRYAGSLCCFGIDEKAAVKKHPDQLQNAYIAGRNFAETIRQAGTS